VIALALLTVLAATPASYGELLTRYVVDDRWVDYDAWHASGADREALQHAIDTLAARDLFALEADAQIAAWINLYNAITVDLILEAWPVASIKDLDDPWSTPRVVVGGRELSLDDIEHGILRRDFDEPRIHFALNCASVSCPPLAATPFTGAELDAQLDARTQRTLEDPEWLDASGCGGAYGRGEIRISKLFDWFEDDFGGEAGIRAFLRRYRPDLRFPIENTGCRLEILDYDWSLNAPPET
jgi:hypothetical protein